MEGYDSPTRTIAKQLVNAYPPGIMPWKIENELILFAGIPFYLLVQTGGTPLRLHELYQELESSRRMAESDIPGEAEEGKRNVADAVRAIRAYKESRQVPGERPVEPVGWRIFTAGEPYYVMRIVPDEVARWYLGLKEVDSVEMLDLPLLRHEIVTAFIVSMYKEDRVSVLTDFFHFHAALFWFVAKTDEPWINYRLSPFSLLARMQMFTGGPVVSEKPWVEMCHFDVCMDAFQRLTGAHPSFDSDQELFATAPQGANVDWAAVSGSTQHLEKTYWRYCLKAGYYQTAGGNIMQMCGKVADNIYLCVPNPRAMDLMDPLESAKCEAAIRFNYSRKNVSTGNVFLTNAAEGKIRRTLRINARPHLVVSHFSGYVFSRDVPAMNAAVIPAIAEVLVSDSVTRDTTDSSVVRDMVLRTILHNEDLDFTSSRGRGDFYDAVYASMTYAGFVRPNAVRQRIALQRFVTDLEYKEALRQEEIKEVKMKATLMLSARNMEDTWSPPLNNAQITTFQAGQTYLNQAMTRWFRELEQTFVTDVGYYRVKRADTPTGFLDAMIALIQCGQRKLKDKNVPATWLKKLVYEVVDMETRPLYTGTMYRTDGY